MKSAILAATLVVVGLVLGVTATPPGNGATLAGILLVAAGWVVFVVPRHATR